MIEKKIIYYQDELNDEFSSAKIVPRTIDEKYKYIEQHSFVWNISSYLLQNIISMPFKRIYAKLKFHTVYIGKEKLRQYKKVGYFMYVNQEVFGQYTDEIIDYCKNFL